MILSRPSRLALIAFMTLLAAWLAAQSESALNFDHVWLLEAAQRLLSGGTMVADFYEVNPPLSVLLYVPMAMLGTIIPPYYTPYALGFLCLVLSVMAVYKILQKWDFLDEQQFIAIVAIYAAANTLPTSTTYSFFAERDQIMMMGLFPFLLLQLSLTWGYKVPATVKYPLLVLGPVAILIKPQYGIYPIAALLYRMAAQKRLFSIVRDIDFLALAAATIGYAMVLIVFFNDYLQVILPDFLNIYLQSGHYDSIPAIITILYTALVFCGLLLPSLLGAPLDKMKLSALCFAAALAGIAIFAVQGKGIYYHLLPALCFFYVGLSLTLCGIASYYGASKASAPLAIILCIILMAMLSNPLGTNRLRHGDYLRTSVFKVIQDCPAPCSFYMFSQSGEIMHQIALYGHADFASRFGVFWWLPAILKLPEDDPERLRLTKKYLTFIREDMMRYKPSRLIIMNNMTLNDEKNFDLLAFLRQDPVLAAELDRYENTGVLKTQWSEYQPAAHSEDVDLIYDLYVRKN